LPVLDNIRVASPCTADWNQMTGDDRVRHCGQCEKNVYNLSGMMRDEAEALLRERNGNLCVRYYQRQDGTILLADCTVGRASRSRHRWIAAGAAAAITAGLGAAAVAHRVGDHQVRMGEIAAPPTRVLMGAIAPPPPTEVHEPAPPDIQVVQGGMSIEPEPPPTLIMGKRVVDDHSAPHTQPSWAHPPPRIEE